MSILATDQFDNHTLTVEEPIEAMEDTITSDDVRRAVDDTVTALSEDVGWCSCTVAPKF